MTAKRQRIFRQLTQERLSSPEQLDTLMRVLSPAGWLALASVAVLLLFAIAWGILGRIPVRVSGDGVLLHSGGVYRIQAPASGAVTSVAVAAGEPVTAGTTIAHLARPDLERQLDEARRERQRAQHDADAGGESADRDAALSERSLRSELAAAEASLATQHTEVERLERKVAAHVTLAADGVITEDVLAGVRLELSQARGRVISGEAEVERLLAELAKAAAGRVTAAEARLRRLEDAEAAVAELEARLEGETRAIALYDGRVVEIFVAAGQTVSAGAPLVAVERQGEPGSHVEVVAYVSALDAYKIDPGMAVQVVPSVVKKEEYGSLLGTVAAVAELPAEEAAMMRVLGNRPLVQQLAAVGLPLEVRVDLIADPSTPSGYRWTSRQGPPIEIHDGTICSLSVVVQQRSPISLVIPGIERALGL